MPLILKNQKSRFTPLPSSLPLSIIKMSEIDGFVFAFSMSALARDHHFEK
jgi:hypothetical protein